MARLSALSPTVASRQCVPILADEIYGDMVSVSHSTLQPQTACPLRGTSPWAGAASAPLHRAWVGASSPLVCSPGGYLSSPAPLFSSRGSLSCGCT